MGPYSQRQTTKNKPKEKMRNSVCFNGAWNLINRDSGIKMIQDLDGGKV